MGPERQCLQSGWFRMQIALLGLGTLGLDGKPGGAVPKHRVRGTQSLLEAVSRVWGVGRGRGRTLPSLGSTREPSVPLRPQPSLPLPLPQAFFCSGPASKAPPA